MACFILRGVLRIADVHGCAPVAVFYRQLDIPERQQPEGFPGISDRATWFMIEYQGAFTVGQDGPTSSVFAPTTAAACSSTARW